MTRDKPPRLGIGAVAAIAVVALAIVATAASAATAAQQAPVTAFIAINPEAGFPLDPFVISLQAGGPVDASTIAKECKGFVTRNPVLSVDYKGKTEILKIFFYSDGDPVLLVQTPDGKFMCNDNTNAALLDPTVTLTKPAQGRYYVWMGSARARDLIPGFLVFTGKGDVSAGGLTLQNLVRRPAQPEVLPLSNRLTYAATRIADAVASVKTAAKLAPGGASLTQQVTATGVMPAPEVATGDSLCSGLITVAPSYAFEWSGQAKALAVMFEGSGDATVIVRTPDGKFICADDADGSANLNPLAIVSSPTVGRYLVWVGRVDPAQPLTGKLTVASSADLKPAILKKRSAKGEHTP
jgi:hypothetical protein